MKKLTLFFILLMALFGLKLAAQAQTCQPPTNISVTTPTGSSAVVSFSPVAGAGSYTVRYWWVVDSTASNAQSVTVAGSPATITGLQYPAYRVTVTSNCTATSGATSAPVTFQFPWSTCGTPTNVQATAANTATGIGATISYGAVSGATSYLIQVLVAGTNVVAASTTSSTTTAYLGGLQANTTYLVRVYAVCASGTSPGYGTASFGTGGSTPTACDSVRNLRVSAITQTSALVSFSSAVSAASYTVQYGLAGTTITTTLNTTATSLTLTGLQAGQSYWVRVRSNCTATSASAFAFTTFQALAPTAPCGTVTNVVVTATSATTATLSFTPGAGNTSFNVFYYSQTDSINGSHYFSTASSPVVLSGLVVGQTYIIRVISVCGTATGTLYNNNGAPVTLVFRGALANRAALGMGVVSVFPNPAHHAASLVLPAVPGAGQAQLALLNALGQQVRTLTVPLASGAETRTQLDLTGVAPGIYTVRVAAGAQWASQRLVVE